MIDRIINAVNQIVLSGDKRLKEREFCKLVEKAFRKANIEYRKELRLLIPLENWQKINRLAFLDGKYYGNVIADFVCGDIAIEVKCVDDLPVIKKTFIEQRDTYLKVPGINRALLIILERNTMRYHYSQIEGSPAIPVNNYIKKAERLIHLTPHLSITEFSQNLEMKENERCLVCQN